MTTQTSLLLKSCLEWRLCRLNWIFGDEGSVVACSFFEVLTSLWNFLSGQPTQWTSAGTGEGARKGRKHEDPWIHLPLIIKGVWTNVLHTGGRQNFPLEFSCTSRFDGCHVPVTRVLSLLAIIMATIFSVLTYPWLDTVLNTLQTLFHFMLANNPMRYVMFLPICQKHNHHHNSTETFFRERLETHTHFSVSLPLWNNSVVLVADINKTNVGRLTNNPM